MVSNSLKLTEEEVVAALKRLRLEHGNDADYQALRNALPKEWPI